MKQVNLRIYRMILPLLMGLFLSVSVYAQNITVKGHVKDAMGEVIGANVVEKGNTSNGTITDLDGNFTLSVPKGATLVVSFIGYQTQEVAAAPSVIITLKDDAELLSEVVVIGYGRAKKNDLTGSVTAIKPDEMNKGLQVSAQDMITGKIAGVNVQNSGGEPGGGASIRIRGGSSLNASNDPLIVIDGLAMDNYGMQGMSNPLNLVNPNDIESFTVLKDASATAIYGSRASNGVIIITTKKGRKNMKPTISYNGNVSVSTVTNKLDVLSANEFMNFIKNKSGLEGADWEASDYYKNMGYWSAYNADGTPADGAQHLFADTDWQDEIYRTAIATDHNITLTGAYKNLPYRVSLGYTKQQGILKTSDFERYTASVSLNPTFLNDHLTVNFNAKGMYSNTTYANTSAIGAASEMDPTKPVMIDSEFYNKNFGGYFQYSSPVLMHERSDYPLHVGVTETGTEYMGTIKSAMGIGGLLCLGIGDTIRVSLTADPVREVVAAKAILKAAGLRKQGVNLISCPTCGRTKIDLIGLANRVQEALQDCDMELTVAVMGCVVNGPGEAREADIGIAGGDGCGVLFVHGELKEKLPYDELLPALLRYIDTM